MNDQNFINEQKYERAKKQVRAISGFYKHLAAYLIVNIILFIVKYANLQPGEQFFTFSTFSTATFWGIGLLCHGLGVFGNSILFNREWEDRKIAKLMDKEKNQKWQ
jgi:hypothetical protein